VLLDCICKLINSMALSPFFERPAVLQLVKNCPAFYETRRFITAFTIALHLSLPWARSIHSIPPHPTSLGSILILSSHLRLCLPIGLYPSGFLTNVLYAFIFFAFVLRGLPISSSLTWSFWLYFAKSSYRLWGSPLCSLPSLLSRHPSSVQTFPLHSVLKHPEFMFLP
jgi:hypothetical protein